VPHESLSIVSTRPIPTNVGINIGDGEEKFFNKEISQGVTMRLYRPRTVTLGFILIIVCINISSERAKEASGR